MVQLFKEYVLLIVPAKTHCIALKEDYSYSEGYVLFLNTAFVGRFGEIVIMLKSSSIVFCSHCVSLKGHSNGIFPRSKVELSAGHFFKQYMLSTGHEHSFICSTSHGTSRDFGKH